MRVGGVQLIITSLLLKTTANFTRGPFGTSNAKGPVVPKCFTSPAIGGFNSACCVCTAASNDKTNFNPTRI